MLKNNLRRSFFACVNGFVLKVGKRGDGVVFIGNEEEGVEGVYGENNTVVIGCVKVNGSLVGRKTYNVYFAG